MPRYFAQIVDGTVDEKTLQWKAPKEKPAKQEDEMVLWNEKKQDWEVKQL